MPLAFVSTGGGTFSSAAVAPLSLSSNSGTIVAGGASLTVTISGGTPSYSANSTGTCMASLNSITLTISSTVPQSCTVTVTDTAAQSATYSATFTSVPMIVRMAGASMSGVSIQ